MTPDQEIPDEKNPDQKTDASVSRRVMAKKAAYIAPAVLAVIALAERPALAASTVTGPPQ
jgi:hypothetical protein